VVTERDLDRQNEPVGGANMATVVKGRLFFQREQTTEGGKDKRIPGDLAGKRGKDG